jgi:KipI family sensor histidine kinase inhibitor
MSGDHRITWIGDSAVVVEFEARIDPAISDRALDLARAIAAIRPTGVRDIVPTYHAVTVHFDPWGTDVVSLFERLGREAERRPPQASGGQAMIRIPVCYGGAYGPDLLEVAAWSGLGEDEVVGRHASAVYRVFMLGFLPGFAYLGSVDRTIAMPRKDSPRVRVPEGSVGIAGEQTGVYPQTSPGGWRIIGRTPMRLFDLSRPQPFLLGPGDLVRFYRIEAAEFEQAARDPGVAA